VFGYINANPEALDSQARERYAAYYCGLCRALCKRYGQVSRAVLSYDMTFLCVLLSSLYEPDESVLMGRCAPRPVHKRPRVVNEASAYAADMNVLLAYHKCLDDKRDEGGLKGSAWELLLRGAYQKVQRRHPDKCDRVAGYLKEIADLERSYDTSTDAAANLTGTLLGEIFIWKQDQWETPLRVMGEALGRFIYFMDAYEDIREDSKKHRYNPLLSLWERDDFETLCREGFMMMISECVRVYDALPLIKDAAILENILFGGVWRRYVNVSEKRGKDNPAA